MFSYIQSYIIRLLFDSKSNYGTENGGGGESRQEQEQTTSREPTTQRTARLLLLTSIHIIKRRRRRRKGERRFGWASSLRDEMIFHFLHVLQPKPNYANNGVEEEHGFARFRKFGFILLLNHPCRVILLLSFVK